MHADRLVPWVSAGHLPAGTVVAEAVRPYLAGALQHKPFQRVCGDCADIDADIEPHQTGVQWLAAEKRRTAVVCRFRQHTTQEVFRTFRWSWARRLVADNLLQGATGVRTCPVALAGIERAQLKLCRTLFGGNTLTDGHRAAVNGQPYNCFAFGLVASGLHDFWTMDGTRARLELSLFYKNVAIMGGLAMVAGFYGPERRTA